jgi:hypothetical protein
MSPERSVDFETAPMRQPRFSMFTSRETVWGAVLPSLLSALQMKMAMVGVGCILTQPMLDEQRYF